MLRSFLIGALTLLGLFAAPVAFEKRFSAKLIKLAETHAGDQPYCLQVSGDGGFKEVRSLDDISPFKMRSTGGEHHAVLVVGADERLFHWSYWLDDFIEGVVGPPALFCDPRPHFLVNLPKKPPTERDLVIFRVARMKFAVPRQYRPGAANGFYRGMSFFGRAPDFQPIDSPPLHELPQSLRAEPLRSLIVVNFDITDRPKVWANIDERYYRSQDVAAEAGLHKRLVWYRRSSDLLPSVQYSEKGANSEIRTSIDCPWEASGYCLHAFHANGWTFTFNHLHRDVAEWKTMQKRLVALTDSFVISGRIASPQSVQ
jgi:hypothetical protein